MGAVNYDLVVTFVFALLDGGLQLRRRMGVQLSLEGEHLDDAVSAKAH